MKKTLALAAFGAALLCFGCGGDTPESVADDSIDLFTEMTDIMTTITDEATAKEAAPKIEALAAEFKVLMEKGEALGEPSEDVKKKLEEKMSAAMDKFLKEMMRVFQIEGAKEQLEKAMEGMSPK